MKSRRKLCSMHSASKRLMASTSESGMDKKTGELILEYVLRQCDKDFIISELIRALPVSNENLRLKKMILLKSISSDLSKRIVSEKTLETLQSLKDLNMQICRDPNSEKSMQNLCCKVAVECTVKCLRGTCKINWDDYNDALRKLWTYRAEDTEDVEMDGEVIDVKKELLNVASDHTLRESVLEKYNQDDVLKYLDAFLKDSWEEMGPSLLEIALEEVAQRSYNLIAGQDLNRDAITDRMTAPSCETGDPACIVPDNNEETTSTFPPPWAGMPFDPFTIFCALVSCNYCCSIEALGRLHYLFHTWIVFMGSLFSIFFSFAKGFQLTMFPTKYISQIIKTNLGKFGN